MRTHNKLDKAASLTEEMTGWVEKFVKKYTRDYRVWIDKKLGNDNLYDNNAGFALVEEIAEKEAANAKKALQKIKFPESNAIESFKAWYKQTLELKVLNAELAKSIEGYY